MYKTYSTLSVQATVSDVFRRRRYNESYVNTCVSRTYGVASSLHALL